MSMAASEGISAMRVVLSFMDEEDIRQRYLSV